MKKIIVLLVFLTFILTVKASPNKLIKLDDKGTFLNFEIQKPDTNASPDLKVFVHVSSDFINDTLYDNYNMFNYKKSVIAYTSKDHKSTMQLESIFRNMAYKKQPNIVWRGMFTIYFYKNSVFQHRILFKNKSQNINDVTKMDEILGHRTHLWAYGFSQELEKEFATKKRPLIIATTDILSWIMKNHTTTRADHQTLLNENMIFEINKNDYDQMVLEKKRLKYDEKPNVSNKNLDIWTPQKRRQSELLLTQSSQPIESDTNIRANIPILLVDEKHHKMRADSDDWRIYTYLNPHNGEFYQYFFFEKELELEWPLYIRDFAMDHLAGAHTCKYSTVAVKNKTHEKVVKKNRGRYDSRDIQITEINNKPWRPDPVPEDKNTIPKNRLFFDVEVGRIFGSRAKVWELKVWTKLPEMLRDNPDGVYLVGYGSLLHLLDTKTSHDEQLLLQKTGVLITPTLYKQLNVLRKSQTENTK